MGRKTFLFEVYCACQGRSATGSGAAVVSIDIASPVHSQDVEKQAATHENIPFQ
jgi:hypothetical protein